MTGERCDAREASPILIRRHKNETTSLNRCTRGSEWSWAELVRSTVAVPVDAGGSTERQPATADRRNFSAGNSAQLRRNHREIRGKARAAGIRDADRVPAG